MENIIFCGGCGSFISNDEISAGKASKINNIYYCLKCSTGQKITPVRPNIPSITSVGNKPPIRPTPPTLPSRESASTPVSPLRSNLSQQAARPVSSKAVPPTPQKPVTTSNRPTVVYQPKPIDTKSTIPVPKPTDHITRRIPMQQTPEVRPITRKIEPPKPITRFSMKPPSPDTNFMNTEEDVEIRPTTRRFMQVQPTKPSMKKIYIIGGAVVGVIIITLLIVSHLSNRAKKDAIEKRYALAKTIYNEIVEIEGDFPDDPQKVLAKIEERLNSVKNTPYENKLKEIEASAKERLDILKKFNKLGASVATTKDEIDERIQEYIQLRSKASDYPKLVEEKINIRIKDLKQEKQKILDEEKKGEDQLKKALDDFKSQADKLKNQKSYKEILKLCEEFLAKPGYLRFQEEVEKIKADAQKEIQEIDEAEKRKYNWQTLNDETSKWIRTGASSTEVYVDDKSQLILKNPSGNTQATILANNNNGENWKDFTLIIEFKIVSGSLDMGVKGAEIPFKRKFNAEWEKYTIEVKGDELTISGGDLPAPKKSKVTTNATPIIIVAKPGDEFIIKELKAKAIK